MQAPDFATMAREWLVQAQGRAFPWHEVSLAKEFERVWKAGYEAGYTDGGGVDRDIEGA